MIDKNDYFLLIKRLRNGFTVTMQNDDPYSDAYQTVVFEEKEQRNYAPYDKEAFEEMLYMIAEYFGYGPEKFEPDNLKISWDAKGSKYES